MGRGSETPAVSTKGRILEAADRMFIERGYGTASIRDLAEAAGVNVAAVNYHFGGKENLYREVVTLRLSDAAERKLALLRAAVGAHTPPDLRIVIRAYVASFLDDLLASPDMQAVMRIVSHEMGEDGAATDILYRDFIGPVHGIMKDAILRARPELSERRAMLAVLSVAGQAVHFVRARGIVKRLMDEGYTKQFLDEIVEHISEFSLRGIG